MGFDSKLLFLGAEIIAPIITKLCNASLTNKIVISDWKVSKLTPIYKGKGNKDEAGHYRPISLICHILKIFEKEIKTQLMVYLEMNDLITIDQSAYDNNNNNTGYLLHAISPKSKEHNIIACYKHYINKLQIHCCKTLLRNIVTVTEH